MEPVIEGLALIADPFNLFLIFMGVLIGVIVGALPGLSSPMARRGEAGRALGIAAVSSVCGGIFSLMIFLLAAPLLARLATSFRPMEYFALAIFALSMLASISGKSSLRNLIGGAIGVLIGTFGIHRVLAACRGGGQGR